MAGFRILLRHLVVVLMQPRPAHARHATEEGVMLIACPGAWHSISSILDRFSGRELREGAKAGERWRGWYIVRGWVVDIARFGICGGLKGYYGVPLWVTSLPQTCPQVIVPEVYLWLFRNSEPAATH